MNSPHEGLFAFQEVRMRDPRFLKARLRSADPKQHTARYVISSEEVAGDGDIVLASAFQRSREFYLENGAFLWHHPWLYDEYVGPRCVIGKPTAIDIFENHVEGEFRYSVDAHDDAKTAWELVQDGSLRTVSVGWYPVKYVTKKSPQGEIDALPPKPRAALLDGSCRAVHTEIDLFEVSQVYHPADKNAVRIRAALLAGNDKSDEEAPPMSTPQTASSPETPGKTDARARAASPATRDCCSRLYAVADSIASCDTCRCCGCNCWDGCKCGQQCCCCASGISCGTCACCIADKVCLQGCCDLLEEILSSCREMAGRAEPAAGPMAASSTAGEQEPQARAGRKLSAASRAKIQEALDAHGRGMAEHKKCARTLTDMIEAIEEDIMEDTEGDEDGKNADAGSRSLSAHVADLLRHRSAP